MTYQATESPAVNSDLPKVDYPPAPWRISGQLWFGLFETDKGVPLPDGLHHVLNSRWAVVILVRYLEGTLHYDELAVGALARKGARLGIWVDRMWVDSLPSVWGGRNIWGLPKELAEFTWSDNHVTVSNKSGMIATLTVNLQPSRLPPIWMVAPGFGQIAGNFVYTLARLWVRPAKNSLQIDEWSTQFPYQIKGQKSRFGFSAKPFHMTIPEGSRK